MSHFSTAFLGGSDDTSCENLSIKQKSSQVEPGTLNLTEFKSENFFSSSPYLSSNYYCPYSVRETQLSVEYKYDVLLIYDPEENSFFVDKLMEYLRPQDLKIFDFLRDSPPGLPQRKVLQSALQVCRYTCIVITRKFITNFWMQLKTDMSIQDMLDNEQKLYSVIVVVMDLAVKRENLPLDLATLSPLFCSEKFFENRLKLAFSKSTPFPEVERPLWSSTSKTRLTEESYHRCPTAFLENQSNVSKSIGSSDLYSSNMKSITRSPREHGDSTFVMPSTTSLFSMQESLEGSSTMHRGISVTVSSTGSRQPTETVDASMMAGKDLLPYDSINSQQVSMSHSQSTDFSVPPLYCPSIVKEPNDSSFPAGTSSIESFHGRDFSCLTKTQMSAEIHIPSASDTTHEHTDVSCLESTLSAFSDLEISVNDESEDHSSTLCSVASATRVDHVPYNEDEIRGNYSIFSDLEISVDSPPDKPKDEFLDAPTSNDGNSLPDPGMSKSLYAKSSEESLEKKATYSSLPANLNLEQMKKSQPVLSLISNRFSKIKKSFSFSRKKTPK